MIDYLASGDDTAAASCSGLNPYLTVYSRSPCKYSTLLRAPHPRTSPKFTVIVIRVTVECFKTTPDCKYTTQHLVSYLAKETILGEPLDEQNFRHQLWEWLQSHGMTLRVGCKELIFATTPGKAAEGLNLVQDHLSLVDTLNCSRTSSLWMGRYMRRAHTRKVPHVLVVAATECAINWLPVGSLACHHHVLSRHCMGLTFHNMPSWFACRAVAHL